MDSGAFACGNRCVYRTFKTPHPHPHPHIQKKKISINSLKLDIERKGILYSFIFIV